MISAMQKISENLILSNLISGQVSHRPSSTFLRPPGDPHDIKTSGLHNLDLSLCCVFKMLCQVTVKMHSVVLICILSNCSKRRDYRLCYLELKATVCSVDTNCCLMHQGRVKVTL